MADTERIAEALALEAVVRERIANLLQYRAWYRARPWTLDWPSRTDNDIELRHLVALARSARRVAQPVLDYTDAVGLSKAYADWTEGELSEAFGR